LDKTKCWKHIHGCKPHEAFRHLPIAEENVPYDCTPKCDPGEIYGNNPKPSGDGPPGDPDDSCMEWPKDIEVLSGMDETQFAANSMKYILETVAPQWDKYDTKNINSVNIKEYWTVKSMGGGPITGEVGLSYGATTGIVTPIFEEIDKETDVPSKVNTKDIYHIIDL